MVKGFRYKLYSTVSDSDQLQKEEKVKSIGIAMPVIRKKGYNNIVHLADYNL